jgi:tRNA threonylcarbamoyladenosine biosynthesis protein TsaE
MSNDIETFYTKNEDETISIGKKFAEKLRHGDAIAFYGDLGAGKTEFIKGICSYFNVDEIVTSPTFTIMNKYSGKKSDIPIDIFHIDLYRIKDTKELEEIGFQDCVYTENAIKLIEWAEKANSHLQEPDYSVKIQFTDDEESREIIIENLIK